MGQVGERLREHRLRYGLSKRTPVRQIRASAPTVLRWEAGTALPNDHDLYRIEQLLTSPDARRALPRRDAAPGEGHHR